MKRLLIVLCALVSAPAWGQPAGSGSAGSGGAGSGSAGSGSATTAGSGSGSAATAGSGSGSAAAPAKPLTIVPGAVESSKNPDEPCGDLIHKAWYEQEACRPHELSGNFWLPIAANKEGDGVDTMFIATLALSAFFFVAITACVVWFVIKYRGRKGHRAEPSPSHNDTMEITWTVIPTIIVVFLFYYGWRGYINMVTPPEKAVEIQVVAKKWNWTFIHSNGVTDKNLHVPVDQPVRLIMTSQDVLHSFFVPSLRTKQDVIPRRYTYAWFEATKPGTYRLYCTEYCGRDHSQMKVVVVVHEGNKYGQYLAEAAAADNTRPLAEVGADQFNKQGCTNCHTTDGTAKVGPTFKDDFGTDIKLTTGETIKMDENYIKESLRSPQAKARQHDPAYPPTMPSFATLKERQVLGLIEFIKKQSKFAPTEPSPEAPPGK